MVLKLNYSLPNDRKLRTRGNLSSNFKLYTTPSKKGSYNHEILLEIIKDPITISIISAYAVNAATPHINNFIKYIFGRALGTVNEIPRGIKTIYKKLSKRQKTEIELLIQNIEPALTRGHSAVGITADQIEIKTKRTSVARLDIETKDYIEAKPSENYSIIDTNITAYNSLSANGRLYDPESGSIIPFSIEKGHHVGTRNAVAASLKSYEDGNYGTIKITACPVETNSGRLKKYLIRSAEEIHPSDWEDGKNPLTTKR